MKRKTFSEYIGGRFYDYITNKKMKQVWDYQEGIIDIQEQEIEELKEKLNQALEVIGFYGALDTWSGLAVNTDFAQDFEESNTIYIGGKKAREFLATLENEK
jgi:hypothetical protein